MDTELEQTAAVLALLRNPPARWSWSDVAREVLTAGSATEVLGSRAGQPSLLGDDGLAAARSEVDGWVREGIDVVSVLDDRYPSRLRDIVQLAPLLFARGEIRSQDEAVSVVGSRGATERGLRMADGIARALVEQGITVVAGLAAGIDTAAHTAALEAGGRTVAMIGTGIRKYYPAPNRALQDQIARDGLLISQFLPDAPPRREHFPMRNAIMSGYGLATIVVEAGERSGTRIQARLAVEHGRAVILTDLVLASTDWGRALLGRPRVFAASGLSDVMEALEQVRQTEAQAVTNALAGAGLPTF